MVTVVLGLLYKWRQYSRLKRRRARAHTHTHTHTHTHMHIYVISSSELLTELDISH